MNYSEQKFLKRKKKFDLAWSTAATFGMVLQRPTQLAEEPERLSTTLISQLKRCRASIIAAKLLLVVSWGDATKTPVLLVHGYMDSAATFSFLVEHLPDTYYYVAFDLPGHGKSDPLLKGPLGDFYYYMEAVRAVVDHFKWTDFVYLAHSMAFVLGTLYNHMFPHKICRMINIDPTAAVTMIHIMSTVNFCMPQLYELNYAEEDLTKEKKRQVFSREQAVRYIMRRRMLTEQQAETVLSRSLVPIDDGTYRLSWCSHSKLIATLPIPASTFYEILTSNPLPMLMLHARDDVTDKMPDSLYTNLWIKIENLHYVKSVAVGGGHDIHITNPEDCAKNIIQFLDNNFSVFIKKSKIYTDCFMLPTYLHFFLQ